ncbi:MAG: hypothetical protein ABL998_06715 [Planctomycetota bacterium]
MKKPVLLVLGLAVVLIAALLTWLLAGSGTRGNAPHQDGTAASLGAGEEPVQLDSAPSAELVQADAACDEQDVAGGDVFDGAARVDDGAAGGLER